MEIFEDKISERRQGMSTAYVLKQKHTTLTLGITLEIAFNYKSCNIIEEQDIKHMYP